MTIREILAAKHQKIPHDENQLTNKIDTERLFTAVKKRDCGQVRLCINNGVDINKKDEYGWTALMHAVDSANPKIVKLLIDFGADVNIKGNDGQTALMNAIFMKEKGISKTLIERGADVNLKDNQGKTALMIAALSDAREIGEFLILKDADIDATDNSGKNAFDIAYETWAGKKDNYFLKPEFKGQYGTNVNKSILQEKYVEEFLKKEFCKNFGYISEVKAKCRKHCDFELGYADLRRFIKNFNANSPDRFLKMLNSEQVQIVPNESETQEFLLYEFDGPIGTIKTKTEIKRDFQSKYNCELDNYALGEFIKERDIKSSCKSLKMLNSEQVQIVPSESETQKFLLNEFDGPIGTIKTKTEIKRDFQSKYNCELDNSALENFIKKFNSSSSAERTIFSQEESFVITSKLHQNLAQLIQRIFLAEKVPCTYPVEKIANDLEKFHGFPDLKTDDIILSVQIANSILRDIKIIFKNNELRSSFKETDMNSSNYNISICPICGIKFAGYSDLQIKTHILKLHTSKNPDESIIVGKSNSVFFCHNCREEVNFYDEKHRPGWIYRHLLGVCKDFSYGESHLGQSPNGGKHIRHGTAYASYGLGNIGQTYRDNGRFGSPPIEDNLGDGGE